MTIEDLVRFEPESTALDFKAIQYSKMDWEALLKDVIAMANADTRETCRIIIGIKDIPGGERKVIGIPEGLFADAAIYQQLIEANIEPSLGIDYVPVEHAGHTLGVLSVTNRNDPPYLMKKDFGKLRRGDGFVRKGTHQVRLIRADLDRMAELRQSERSFSGHLILRFSESKSPVLGAPVVPRLQLPSQRAETRIRGILAERERLKQSGSPYGFRVGATLGLGSPFNSSYEQMSDERLRELLLTVKSDYAEHDLYERFELRGTQVQLELLNEGDEYIEDGSIEISVPHIPGFLIAEDEYTDPEDHPAARIRMRHDPDYPTVTDEHDHVKVSAYIGNVRHKKVTPVFGVPLRIVVEEEALGVAVPLSCRIFGKNIRKPPDFELELRGVK